MLIRQIIFQSIGTLQKLFFDDLSEGFVPKLSFGKFGILCVLRAFQKEKLGAKTRPNRIGGVFGGAQQNTDS